MILVEDLIKLSENITEDDNNEYQKFKNGFFKLQLISEVKQEYCDNEKWEFFCDREQLFIEDENEIKEIPFLLAPAIFKNPLFTKIEILPHEQHEKIWLAYQEKEKKYQIINRTYLIEFKEKHSLEYKIGSQEPIKVKFNHFYLRKLPENCENMSKEEFFMIKPPSPVVRRSCRGPKTPPKNKLLNIKKRIIPFKHYS